MLAIVCGLKSHVYYIYDYLFVIFWRSRFLYYLRMDCFYCYQVKKEIMVKNNNKVLTEKGSFIPRGKHAGTVVGVAIGKERGTSKKQVPHIDLKEGCGILGDAHVGTEKQVSLVAEEEIDHMNKLHNIQAHIGDFAENIATRGIDLMSFLPGDHIQVGPAVLKVLRLGKSREEMRGHTFSFKGYTLLPKRGLFCEVIKGGRVRPGDEILVICKGN